jgi:type IV pilus assembly protein PilO
MSRFIIIIVLLLLIMTGFVISYFFLLKPVEFEVEQTIGKLKQEDLLIKALEKRVQDNTESATIDLVEIQRKIPSEPFIDRFLLDLRSIEQSSNNDISSLSISEEDAGTLLNVIQSEAETSGQTPATEQILKKVSVTISLISPTYNDLQKFIEGIEGLERITKVGNIGFGTETKDISYNLSISTFYAPQFQGLVDELPSITFPVPSKKTNPLVPNYLNQPTLEPQNNQEEEEGENQGE